jgi:hypothetical protein
VSIPPEQEPEEAAAQAADAVVEHDGSRHAIAS